jgi:hypothetical protein
LPAGKAQPGIEEELLLAKKVQESLMPKGLVWREDSVETFYQPAHAIGGDFGLVILGVDYLDVMVCDLSGMASVPRGSRTGVYTEIMALIQRGTELTPMLRQLDKFALR